ncbi:MAG: bifunctional 5,10-methylenetetrahydrofolate dehydrogenase/5,10-methenyltetrahydrofolate cyclohydrolase [Flavobacteriales bacterium]
MKILSGTACANGLKEELKIECDELSKAQLPKPKLVAVLVGDDGASQTYVNAKIKACAFVGYESEILRIDENVTENQLIEEVEKLNANPEVTGFIIQLPLPEHINNDRVTMAIDPIKDVDGFHPENIGKMVLGLDTYLPATPYGIFELLKRNGISAEGKHCVILGRSHIVGTPMNLLMSRKTDFANATVTMLHSRSKDIKTHCLRADIIIAAIGRPNFVTADMVKKGAVVIDVGIHRIEDATRPKGFRLQGDVDFEHVSEICSAISPVPGGVGPMTIVSLLKNTMKAYRTQHQS